jgi:hypothetical protein
MFSMSCLIPLPSVELAGFLLPAKQSFKDYCIRVCTDLRLSTKLLDYT